jgi:Icc-related predicted phosphoesterase
VMIDGLKVYGSPITPTYHDWAFNVLPGSPIAEAWEKIPLDTDVLITHGPPKGILDKNSRDELLGCPELLRKVKEIKPKLHTFGHVHEGYGFVDIDGIRYVNAAIGEQGLKPSIITDI